MNFLLLYFLSLWATELPSQQTDTDMPYEGYCPQFRVIWEDSAYKTQRLNITTNSVKKRRPWGFMVSLPSEREGVKLNLKGQIAYGVSLIQYDNLTTKLIWADPSFKDTSSTHLTYMFEHMEMLDTLVGGKYQLSFDSLVQIDSKGRRLMVRDLWEYCTGISIEVYGKADPWVRRFGKPQLGLRINGTWSDELPDSLTSRYGPLVKPSDKIELAIKNPDPTRIPNFRESLYQTNGVNIYEDACFGMDVKWRSRKDTLLSFPITLPNDLFWGGWGGVFMARIAELYRVDENGERYRIPLPALQDASVMFYKPWRQ